MNEPKGKKTTIRRYLVFPRQADSNKHSSLVRKFANDVQKSFITLAPAVELTKLFSC